MKNLGLAHSMKSMGKKYAKGGEVGADERKARLKGLLFSYDRMKKDPAEEQMGEDLEGKEDFLSDEGEDELMMAEGGEVAEPMPESNSKRKNRIRSILADNHMKMMKKG